MSDWTQAECEVVDAVTEDACAELWATQHDGDTLKAARNWDTIQEWVKARTDEIHTLPPILSPMTTEYGRSIQRHRTIVQYCVERGFIAACDLHSSS